WFRPAQCATHTAGTRTAILSPYTTLFRSLQRTFKKSFTSFSHSTRNKTRDGLIRVRNIRALNGRFNTSITHAYSIESAIQGSNEIGRAVQQEFRDRSRMPSSA